MLLSLTQYLKNSQRLQDQHGVSDALSNLGVLTKMMGLQGYQERVKSVRRDEEKTEARDVLTRCLQRAVSYLEHHLGIEEELNDL